MASRKKKPALYPLHIHQPGGYYAGRTKILHRWGFVDAGGNVIIEATFAWAGRFCDGLARISSGGDGDTDERYVEHAHWGFVNPKGKLVIDACYDGAGDFSEGLAPVLIDAEREDGLVGGEDVIGGKWGYVDVRGDYVIKPKFGAARGFADGLAAVERENEPGYGYIDQKGKWVIKPKYERAGEFGEGLAPVVIDGKYGYIDRSENVVVAPMFERAEPFSDGLAAVRRKLARGDRLRYINREGKTVIEMEKNAWQIKPFSEGLAAVRVSGKWGYIDTRGTMKIKPRFDTADPLRDGIALVEDVKGARYIDKQGKVVITPVAFKRS